MTKVKIKRREFINLQLLKKIEFYFLIYLSHPLKSIKKIRNHNQKLNLFRKNLNNILIHNNKKNLNLLKMKDRIIYKKMKLKAKKIWN